jgi:hypothetical protein
MSKLLYLILCFPIFASADVVYFQGAATFKQGAYAKIESSEIALIQNTGAIRLCAVSEFSGGSSAKMLRQWTQWGDVIYAGNIKEGYIRNNRLYSEKKYGTPETPQTLIVDLEWNPVTNKFLFTLKDTVLGGYFLEGSMQLAPSEKLKTNCDL